jgi:hypothetical protein
MNTLVLFTATAMPFFKDASRPVTAIGNKRGKKHFHRVTLINILRIMLKGTTGMKRYSAVFLLLLFMFTRSFLTAQTDITVGVIKWDAWVGSGHPVGEAVELALSPAEYHYRVPFYGQVISPSLVKIQGTAQEVTDEEIYYANYAGIDYFAFVWYHDTCLLSSGRDNYLNSTNNPMINYCLIVESQRFLTEMSYDNLLSHFARPQYQKVMGTRPLFYFLGTSGLTSGAIATLRNTSIASGLGNPYIVLLCTGEYLSAGG